MQEVEPKCIVPKPKDILTQTEADLLQRIDRGEIPCPCCGATMWGYKMVVEEYEGIILGCNCGFVEL